MTTAATRGREFFLQSPRLGFSYWRADDLELALKVWGDAKVTRLVGGPFSEQQVRERLATEIANQSAYGVQYWPIFRLADHALVGCCGLRPVDGDLKAFEMGFYLQVGAWGHGYGLEAARAVVRFAFDILPIRALYAGHHPENAASRRVLAAVGFRYLRDEHYPPTGLMHPYYELKAADAPGVLGEPSLDAPV